MVLFAACFLMTPGSASASLFGTAENEEISPLQYAALLALRDVDRHLFVKKIMPLIDRAMRDGRITGNELREIERAAEGISVSFYREATRTAWETQTEAQKEGGPERKHGDESGGKSLGKILDDFLDYVRRHGGEDGKRGESL